MKTFKQHINEGYAKATGRWPDFSDIKLIYNGKRMKIYSGNRLGKVIFETQLYFKRKWNVVQYANTIEEAKTVPALNNDWRYIVNNEIF